LCSPKLYLVLGIIVPIPHLVGLKGVAINKDANAPIFEIMPALTETLEKSKSS
jgi:electron transfer flavoprotein alpha subunit